MRTDQNFTQKPGRYIGAPRKKDFYDLYINKIIENNIGTVLELGCATGDFLYHLPRDIKGIGVDISEDLIKEARRTRLKDNLEFICQDVFEYSVELKPQLVVMTGFLCTFLEFERLLKKAISLTEKYIFINDFINNYGVDCKYLFREQGETEFQAVYNIWSKTTLARFLDTQNIKYSIEPYEMTSLLLENENPMYNYHAELNEKKILLNNGGIILDGCNIFMEKN